MAGRVVITRQELTGRLRYTADRMDRYAKDAPLSVTIPTVTLKTWVRELRKLEASVHALPDMRPAEW